MYPIHKRIHNVYTFFFLNPQTCLAHLTVCHLTQNHEASMALHYCHERLHPKVQAPLLFAEQQTYMWGVTYSTFFMKICLWSVYDIANIYFIQDGWSGVSLQNLRPIDCVYPTCMHVTFISEARNIDHVSVFQMCCVGWGLTMLVAYWRNAQRHKDYPRNCVQ